MKIEICFLLLTSKVLLEDFVKTMNSIKVLILEDEPIIAEHIKDILWQDIYKVVGLAHSKEEAIQLLDSTPPDIALLDINLGNNLDGIEVAEYINAHIHIPFLYLTSYSSKIILEKVKHTFPMGYIVKPFNESDVTTSIEIALSNYKIINKKKQLTINLVNQWIDNQLTDSEFNILKDIFNGLSNHEIADQHFVSINTVKTHIRNIYSKIGVRNRAQAITIIRKLLN